MKKTLTNVLVLTVLVGGVFAAPLGAARVNVSRTSVNSMGPRVAIDAAGHNHVAWTEVYEMTQRGSPVSGDVFYSYSADGASWTTPVNLSSNRQVHATHGAMVDVDTDAAGNVYVLWTQGPSIVLRVRSGGSWGAPFTVTSSNFDGNAPVMQVDAAGNIFAAWNSGDFKIYSRARVNGTWESVRQLGSPGKMPYVGIGNGQVYVAYMDKSGGSYKIRVTHRPKSLNSTWTTPAIIPGTNMSYEDEFCAIQVDSSDRATVGWSYYQDGPRQMMASSQGSGGGWQTPQAVSRSEVLHYPAATQYGATTFLCWQVGAWGNGVCVEYAIRMNGAWGGYKTVPETSGATHPDVDVNANGSEMRFVWDSGGEIYFNRVSVTGGGTPPPEPGKSPVARFNFTPNGGIYPLRVTFDGSTSSDPDGTIAAYAWDFGDGVFGAGKIVQHTYTRAGNFTIRLTVTDNAGLSGTAEDVIQVKKANVPPVADFDFTPEGGLTPLQVYFDGSVSRDPDGMITSWSWDFGDGGKGAGARPGHLYRTPGSFTIRLTVWDDQGASNQTTRRIVVKSIRNPLNIRWSTHADESLFYKRYITDVQWESNPANDAVGIAGYRIWRKPAGSPLSAFAAIAQVDAGARLWRDNNVGGVGLYDYTVTAFDGAGHESTAGAMSLLLDRPTAEPGSSDGRPILRSILRDRL